MKIFFLLLMLISCNEVPDTSTPVLELSETLEIDSIYDGKGKLIKWKDDRGCEETRPLVRLMDKGRITNLTLQGGAVGLTIEGSGTLTDNVNFRDQCSNAIEHQFGDRNRIRFSKFENCGTGIKVDSSTELMSNLNSFSDCTLGITLSSRSTGFSSSSDRFKGLKTALEVDGGSAWIYNSKVDEVSNFLYVDNGGLVENAGKHGIGDVENIIVEKNGGEVISVGGSIPTPTPTVTPTPTPTITPSPTPSPTSTPGQKPVITVPSFSKSVKVSRTIVITSPGVYDYKNVLHEWNGPGICNQQENQPYILRIAASNVTIKNFAYRNAPDGIHIGTSSNGQGYNEGRDLRNIVLDNVVGWACEDALTTQYGVKDVLIKNSTFFGNPDKQYRDKILQLNFADVTIENSKFKDTKVGMMFKGNQNIIVRNSEFLGIERVIVGTTRDGILGKIGTGPSTLKTQGNNAADGGSFGWKFIDLDGKISGESRDDQLNGARNKTNHGASLRVN